MKKYDKNYKKIMEILLIVSIATIGMLVGIYYMPLQFIIFLYGIPFVVLGIKYGINTSIIGMIVSAFIIGLLTDYISGISLLLIFLPLSISLIYTIKNRKKPSEIIIITTMVLIISFFLILGIIGDITGVSVGNQLDEFFTQLLDMRMEVLSETDLTPYEIFRFQDAMEDTINDILLQIPAMFMIMSLIITYVNYLASVFILRHLGYGIMYTPQFSKFKLPNNILFGVGLMLGGSFLLKVFKMPYYESVFINITLLVSFVFFLQGFAVINFKLKERKANLVLRLVLSVFLLILIPLGTFITFLGVLDSIFDFRKLRKAV